SMNTKRLSAINRVSAMASTKADQLSALLLLSAVIYLSAVVSAIADRPSADAQKGAQLAPTWKPQGRETFEKYDNPPAPPRKIETSPRMISRFGPFTSFQVNVDASGNNIIGD